MIIGLRMGLTALKALDSRGWFGIRSNVHLRCEPPVSCIIDGIQSSTGCTMGKRNIKVEEAKGVSAEFYTDEEKILITLKDNVLASTLKSLTLGNEAVDDCMSMLRVAPDEGLFRLEYV